MSTKKIFSRKNGKTPEEVAHKIALILVGNHINRKKDKAEYEKRVNELEQAIITAIRVYLTK
ncbi:hypothetical protein ID80_004805 [Salmonella enterica subsp. enterica serovar Ball]|nr:hypothetical protein [Salmonella enterica subsp. enterica serovar Minnesota]ECI4647359.1 hypothetical protein [Salmonella enterica subsp. salamae]EDV5024129.1 hypothetical protein [Salmonella enterica subsp. enterica serovar Ball]EGO7253158.1 hypothetical protein [Salmonella enterica]EJC3639756.1 hypothetical protein [Salmonella enterica]